MQPVENSESLSPLQAHLHTLHTLPLHKTIQAIQSLLPNLTPSISPAGTRLVSYTHSDNRTSTDQTDTLAGYGNLDTLGGIYLKCARRCRYERAPFKTRLLHSGLENTLEDLYVASEKLRRGGLQDGSVKIPPPSEDEVQMCACCRGDPDATILMGFHQDEAFYFWEDEYRDIFGDEKEIGSRSNSEESFLMASRGQVERKAREVEEGLSKL